MTESLSCFIGACHANIIKEILGLMEVGRSPSNNREIYILYSSYQLDIQTCIAQVVQNFYCNFSMMLWSPSSGKKSAAMTPGSSIYKVKVGERVSTIMMNTWSNWCHFCTFFAWWRWSQHHQNIAVKILNNFEQCMSQYRAGVMTNHWYHDPQVIHIWQSWVEIILLHIVILCSRSCNTVLPLRVGLTCAV